MLILICFHFPSVAFGNVFKEGEMWIGVRELLNASLISESTKACFLSIEQNYS